MVSFALYYSRQSSSLGFSFFSFPLPDLKSFVCGQQPKAWVTGPWAHRVLVGLDGKGKLAHYYFPGQHNTAIMEIAVLVTREGTAQRTLSITRAHGQLHVFVLFT